MQAFDTRASADNTTLFDDDSLADDRLLLSVRHTSPRIRPDLVQAWLGECLTKHGGKCTAIQSPKSRMINVLRLIDVRTKSGQAQKLKITRANKENLSKPGALVGKVSKTIEDAIALTESLGIRYPWVDALCILQDDTSDKMVHLDFMSEIYRYPRLTVIAACGTDAAASLAGVCDPRENLAQQHVLKVREADSRQTVLYLTTTPEIRHKLKSQYSHLDNTSWARRGWTLQEKVVSRRTIIVTPHQVYWSCRTSEYTEAMFLETHLVKVRLLTLGTKAAFLTGGGSMEEGGLNDHIDVARDQFGVATNNFSQRQLTMPGDAYDAVNSITQEFSGMVDVHCVWGIPVSRFDLGLCWTRSWELNGQARLSRRTVKTTLPMTTLKREVPFPSWSWLGWMGATTLRLTDQFADGISPDVLSFTLRHNPLRVVRVDKITGPTTEQPIPAFLRNLKMPKSPLTVTVEDVVSTYAALTEDKLKATPDDQLVFFWTEVTDFSLVGPIHELNTTYRESDFYRFEVHDETGQKVGSTDYCVPQDPDDTTCILGEGRHEFVLLGRSKVGDNPAQKVVLQIVREEGIVKRVGIADILENAWEKAKPRRELIAMG
ncbi:hypothetical protein OQA88_913 [Cercophora sp. LCS_1]